MYKPEHFRIHELAPKAMYESMINNSHVLWGLFDQDLLMAIDWLRDMFGPATINNYYWGGAYEWSGLRTVDCPVYSVGSQHSKGRGVDMKFTDISSEDIRKKLISMKYVPWITRIENDVSWLHIDTKETHSRSLYMFNP